MAALPENDRIAGPFIALAGQTDFPADFPLIKAEGLRLRRDRAGAVAVIASPDVQAVDVAAQSFTARLSHPALAGDRIWVFSDLPAARLRQHTPNGAIRTPTLEGDAEELQAQLQEHRHRLDRSLTAPFGETGLELPPVAVRREAIAYFNADGGLEAIGADEALTLVGLSPESVGSQLDVRIEEHFENDPPYTRTSLNNAVFLAPDAGARPRSLIAKLRDTVALDDYRDSGDADDTLALGRAQAVAHAVELPARWVVTSDKTPFLPRRQLVGKGPAATVLTSSYNGRILELVGNCDGGGLFDMTVYGGQTAQTGLYASSDLEEAAHFAVDNVRFWNLFEGIAGSHAFALFDSSFHKVDFLDCSHFGFGLGGSQNKLSACSFRNCGWGIFQYSPGPYSIGGGSIDSPLFVGNNYDLVIGSSIVRPLRLRDGWSEGSKASVVGSVVGGEIWLQSLLFDDFLFQPAATSLGSGICDLGAFKGRMRFRACGVFNDHYANAALPMPAATSTAVVSVENPLRFPDVLQTRSRSTAATMEMPGLPAFADNVAAADGGVPVGGIYILASTGALTRRS